jgi:SAM-dependent methyltransferase
VKGLTPLAARMALGRTEPVSRRWGTERGLPIDRYYINAFLARHRRVIRGRVLEVGEDRYSRRYGTDLEHVDILDFPGAGNPRATVVADLARADALPDAVYDCAVVTQTLQMIWDVRAAARHLRRILRPRGTLLLTTHGISKIDRTTDRDGQLLYSDYWHLTLRGVLRLLEEVGFAHVEAEAFGNALVAAAFLQGLAAREVPRRVLECVDPEYEVLIGAAATN